MRFDDVSKNCGCHRRSDDFHCKHGVNCKEGLIVVFLCEPVITDFCVCSVKMTRQHFQIDGIDE